MATKNVNKTRLLMKHDIEANWLKAENFIPLEGEIVVYDADETHSRPRMKIGDGETQVGALPFATVPIDVDELEGSVVKTINSIGPDENGDVNTVVDFFNNMTTNTITIRHSNPEELWDILLNYGWESLDIKQTVIFNENENAKVYKLTGYEITSIVYSATWEIIQYIARFDFGEEAPSLILDILQHTVVIDPDWVAPNPTPDTFEAHQMLVTNADGEKVWEERTHYIRAYKEYIPEVSLTVVTDEAFTGFPYPYTALELPNFNSAEYDINEIYTITYNGVNYDCKFTYISGYGLCAGNLSALNGPSNNEPFAIAIMNTMNPVTLMVLAIDQVDNATITLKISNDTARVKKLDKKFLPNGLFYMEYEDSIEIARGATNSTYEDTIEATVPLEENKEYIVIIQGQEYNVKCKRYTNLNVNLNFLYLGNLAIFDLPEFSDTGELFLIIDGKSGLFSYQYDSSLGYGEDIVIKTAPFYTKMPFEHLPASNWDSRENEEGYIKNRTHWSLPGLTATWNPSSPGTFQNIEIFNETYQAYKLSDSFFKGDISDLSDLGKITLSSGTSIILFVIAKNQNNDFIVPTNLDSDSLNNFVMSISNSSTVFDENISEEPVIISLPSSGIYYLHKDNTTHEEAFALKIQEKIKKLDSKYTDNTEIKIISSDYDAWVTGATRIENPVYYCNLTGDELVALCKENRLGNINLYYTPSSSDKGQIIPIERIEFDYFDPSAEDPIITFYCYTPVINEKYASIYIRRLSGNNKVGINSVNWHDAVEDLATKTYVETAVANLVDSSPDALNTLNELAAALGDDPNFATTVTNQIAAKVDKTTMINGKALNSNITLNTEDIGAAAKSEIATGILNTFLTTGTGEAYEITISGVTELYNGLNFKVRFHVTNSVSNPTLKINDFEAKTIGFYKNPNGEYPGLEEVNQLIPTKIYTISYFNGFFILESGTELLTNFVHELNRAVRTRGAKEARGYDSFAQGGNTSALGDGSHAEGYLTISIGSYSHAEGIGSISIGNFSHAEGRAQTILPINLTGEANTTTYTYSTDYDYSTLSLYKNSAIRYDNNYIKIIDITENTITLEKTINSNEALADFKVNIIGAGSIGQFSHSEGEGTAAIGHSSHAEGNHSTATGEGSHAEGSYTQAKGLYSHAEGLYTIAASDYQHVMGKHNVEDTENNYAVIVGGGSDEYFTKSNIHTLNWDGTAWYQGDVYVGGSGQDDAAAEKLVKQSELDAAVTNLPVLDNIVLKDSVTGVHYTLYIANGEIMIKNEVVE